MSEEGGKCEICGEEWHVSGLVCGCGPFHMVDPMDCKTPKTDDDLLEFQKRPDGPKGGE